MALRPDDPRSPSRQIFDELRRMIALGELASGAQLPSNAELRSSYGVSNQTAQNAINALKRENLVFSVPGKGVFVRSDFDQNDLLGQLAGDDERPELYNDLLARLVKLDEAQSSLSQAIDDITKRVEAIEGDEGGKSQVKANSPTSMSDG